MARALILVDIQNDFLPGGALPVPQGDQIISLVARLVNLPFFAVIIASKDWHPLKHSSFASFHGRPVYDVVMWKEREQRLWPDHCIQETPGAALASGWDTRKVHKTILKGTDPEVDSYSAFFDNTKHGSTGLEDYLRESRVTEVYIAGLATDYCVRSTALDALDLGFAVYLITDACRGIDPEGVQRTLEEIQKRGGHLVSMQQVEERNRK